MHRQSLNKDLIGQCFKKINNAAKFNFQWFLIIVQIKVVGLLFLMMCGFNVQSKWSREARLLNF